MKFISHIVEALDDNLEQRCVICGELISDYKGCVYPSGQEPPKGFPEGEIFVSGGNPKIFTIEVDKDDITETCRPTGF